MKRIGAVLLGIWLIFTGILGMDLISLSGVLAEIVDKGLPVLAIIAGIFLLIGNNLNTCVLSRIHITI